MELLHSPICRMQETFDKFLNNRVRTTTDYLLKHLRVLVHYYIISDRVQNCIYLMENYIIDLQILAQT